MQPLVSPGMRFPPSIIEEIKARLPVSAVVGRKVKLMRAGREWKGLSPFNAEKTPSFTVNDQKGFYKCFSSGRSGDIISFVMETEGLDFSEAVERLAGEAGVALPAVSAETVESERRRSGLHEAMAVAQAFFIAELAGPRGREARGYLAGRGLDRPALQAFGIGFAPDEKFALRDHLAGKGFSREVMIEAGLLIHGEEITVPYDRFRGRIMFPIADGKGRIIAFGGRALAKDAPAKYLNSPETPLFHKGATLFNLHRARQPAHETGTIHVVEGYMDVVAMSRAGLGNTVAPLGTALTEEQLKLLWRLCAEPILCFDGDKAGLRAANRAVDVALPLLQPGKSLRFVVLPEGQDPDDLFRAGGAGAVTAAVAEPRALFDVMIAREEAAQPLDTPERRADFEQRLRALVGRIADETVQRHYRLALRDHLAAKFAAKFAARPASPPRPGAARAGGFRAYPRAPWPARRRDESEIPMGGVIPADALLRTAQVSNRGWLPGEVALVVALANHPEIAILEAETLAALEFSAEPLGQLARFILNCAAVDVRDRETLANMLTGTESEAVLEEARRRLNPADLWALPEAESRFAEAAWREAAALHLSRSTLNTEIQRSEAQAALDVGVTDETHSRPLAELYALVDRRETRIVTE